MRKSTWIVGAGLLLAIICSLGAWRSKSFQEGGLRAVVGLEPAQFAKIDELRAEANRLAVLVNAPVQDGGQPGATQEDVIKVSQRLSDERAKLSKEQLALYTQSRREEIREQQMDLMAAMSPEETTAMLDRMIDYMQSQMNDPSFAQDQAEARAAQQEAELALDSDGKRKEANKQLLDSSSSRVRAVSEEMHRKLLDRMKERGVPIPAGF